ncbi:MAG: TIGR01212 family radical SAM protein [Lentihominibacter sp.]
MTETSRETKGTPIIYDTSDGQELRINMISPWLKKHFANENESNTGDGRTLKIVKLSLDGGFTCPNRDGSKGTGGCCFCSESGSGDMASGTAEGIRTAMQRQISLLSDKWPEERYRLKYIAYFQSHTNTYGPVEKLRDLFEAALELPEVAGLAIATRSDCISRDVLELLDELNRKTFLWVELGLQTIHDETSKAMNLCHGFSDYRKAVCELTERNIRIVTHLILGLPGESREMMLQSVAEACRTPENLFGLKLHMLNVVRGSGMEKQYPDYVPFETMDEYIDLLIEALEIIPPEVTLHRISGDAPRNTLISPEWSYRKRTILNKIHKEMRQRNTWQGRLWSID